MNEGLLPEVSSTEEYRRLFASDEVWTAAIEEIARREGLVQPLIRGRLGSNIVFRSGEGRWIKLCAPMFRDEVGAEVWALELAGSRIGVAVPEVVSHAELSGWPYLILSEVPGASATDAWRHMSPARQLDVVSELGAALRRLHTCEYAPGPAAPREFSRWVPTSDDALVMRHRRTGLPEEWIDAIPSFVRGAIPELDDLVEKDRTLIHADITSDHVLITEDGASPALAGLIDFADAMIGPWEYDLVAPAVFLMRRRSDLLGALLHSYGWERGGRDVSTRLLAWTILHRFSNLPRSFPEEMQEVPAGDLETLARLVFPDRDVC